MFRKLKSYPKYFCVLCYQSTIHTDIVFIVLILQKQELGKDIINIRNLRTISCLTSLGRHDM